jgi:ArsR family transcriptional regulator, lead/cadmium/zinc/bismuth-responsive transcriptional repressor
MKSDLSPYSQSNKAIEYQLAVIFKAMSDPARIELIGALLQQELCYDELSSMLDMEHEVISHQLRFLYKLRIIKRRKLGKEVCYSIVDSNIKEMISSFHAIISNMQKVDEE